MPKINAIGDLNKWAEADSHADCWKTSTLERNFRESRLLETEELRGMTFAMYPRVKRLRDGRYFLIFQGGHFGGNILCAVSDDGLHYSTPQIILSDKTIFDGADTRRYMTADACVLDNGDVLVVSAFRAVNGYRTEVWNNGIIAMHSSDCGKTWSEERVIYVGTNWEPFVFQLSSGEVQVYFSATAEKIYLYGYKDERISSGVGMIRSYDRGMTFTPDVKEPPYAPPMVMKQYTVTRSDGVHCFTDQMASAVELNNGAIALAGESRFPAKPADVYKVSTSNSFDNWAHPLGFDEAGPETRSSNMFLGCAPYLGQFKSGETALIYNQDGYFFLRVGSSNALEFGKEQKAFDLGGFWGNLLVDSSHSAIAVCPAFTPVEGAKRPLSRLSVGRFYLNHKVYAKELTPVLDGDCSEWADNTDALFIGSDSQAQVSFRFAYDKENVYILAELLDNDLTSGDRIAISLDDYNFEVDLFGNSDAEVAVCLAGSLDDSSDADTGAIFEIKVPSKYVKGNEIKFNAVLYNKDGDNEVVKDTFSNIDPMDKSTWLTVELGE